MNCWFCPNAPPCPHPGLLHDIEELDDPNPICCADDCACGRAQAAAARFVRQTDALGGTSGATTADLERLKALVLSAARYPE